MGSKFSRNRFWSGETAVKSEGAKTRCVVSIEMELTLQSRLDTSIFECDNKDPFTELVVHPV